MYQKLHLLLAGGLHHLLEIDHFQLRRLLGAVTRFKGNARQQSSQSLGFSEMLARGILERGESLGINKTLMSAVSELKVRHIYPLHHPF